MRKISIIIPCYNEMEAIPFFYEEMCKVKKELQDYDFELLFVNDGSSDDTLSVLKDLSHNDTAVKYISFSRNFGKEAAMYAGFCNASGDYVAVMDADMQDPPSLLPQMISILETGEYDSVATRRVSRKGEPLIRSWFARMFYKIINAVSDTEVVDGARDFRLMKRDMVEAIIKMSERNRFSKGIFGWIGYRTYWLEFENVERVAGETKWSFFGLLTYALDGFINFSEAPLLLASWLGLFMTITVCIFTMFIFIRRLIFGDPVDGWASTICIIGLIGGLQLFCVGLIGQYIAKVYSECKNRPHYIIAESNSDEIEKIR